MLKVRFKFYINGINQDLEDLKGNEAARKRLGFSIKSQLKLHQNYDKNI